MLNNVPEKLRKKTLRERIYEELVRMIVSGELPSNGLIKEKQLTQKLQVSRTPFREAIGTLAKEGLVEIKPYCGFSVRRFSRKNAKDLYELYKRLEGFAVELALPKMSDCDIASVEQMLREAAFGGDSKAYAACERNFLTTIASQSENGALIETVARLDLQIQLCGKMGTDTSEFAERVIHGHDDIVQAFKARDIPRAAFLMRIHLNLAQEAMLARYPD